MIRLITNVKDLQQILGDLKGSVGLVPTMGNLHEGHLSLARRALTENDHLIITIFVNPKQFAPGEDFEKYPRTLDADLEKINTLEAKTEVMVFSPAGPKEIYPEGLEREISVTGISGILEGSKRPTHFTGVTTVVYRLFELTRPARAYFGLKDYQQYLLIKQMAADLCLPIEIIGMPIIRESSGLALSSRNQYLTQNQKAEGLLLFKTLTQVKGLLRDRKIDEAKSFVDDSLKDSRWDYLSIRDAETLSEDISRSNRLTILGVLKIGSVRLLDNVQVELE